MAADRKQLAAGPADVDCMPTPGIVLETASPPFNWCDGRCERCPLAGECAILSGERGERDDPGERGDAADSGDELRRAFSRLEKLVLLLEAAAASRADHEGHPPNGTADAPDPPSEGLEIAADAVLFGLGDLLDARERGTFVEPFEGLVSATAFVISRARRLAVSGPFALRRSGDGSLDWEASASVVLLDRAVAALRRTVATLQPREPVAALSGGLAALAPEVARWNARVSDAFRIALGARIREGTAPSPFCTTDH